MAISDQTCLLSFSHKKFNKNLPIASSSSPLTFWLWNRGLDLFQIPFDSHTWMNNSFLLEKRPSSHHKALYIQTYVPRLSASGRSKHNALSKEWLKVRRMRLVWILMSNLYNIILSSRAWHTSLKWSNEQRFKQQLTIINKHWHWLDVKHGTGINKNITHYFNY